MRELTSDEKEWLAEMGFKDEEHDPKFFNDKCVGFEVKQESIQSRLTALSIDEIQGSLPDFEEKPGEDTVTNNTDIVVTGKVDIPDQKFRVPFQRVDTGRIEFMVADVKGGSFTLTVNFKTGGKWVVNTELINSELPAPIFEMKEHCFFVI